MIVRGAFTLGRRQPLTLGSPVYHSVPLPALLLLVGVGPDLHGALILEDTPSHPRRPGNHLLGRAACTSFG